ncbi:MAG: PAS domain-containing protein [Burkholderiales bacterium]|nr:PAS domain-containing protein [Burkholderiales bacterium]
MPAFLRFSLGTRVTLALSIGLGILLVIGVFGFYSAGEFLKTREEVRRLLLVRENLEVLRRDMERAESAQIRYRYTGDPADQLAYGGSAQRVLREIANLRTVLAAPDQKGRLDQFKQIAQARLDALAEPLPGRGAGSAGAVPSPGRQSAADRKMQGIANAIAERERQMTAESEDRVENLVALLLTLAVWGGAMAVALLIWTVFVINRYDRGRRRVERDLANARQRLDYALEGSKSAAWDWDVPRNEVYLSAGWLQMLGAPAQETTVAPAVLFDLVHPEDAGRVQSAIKGVLNGSTADYSEEHRVRRVDDSWIWILSRGKVVQRGGGSPLRITGTNHDVTERKSIELMLQEHDLRLQLALATAGMVRWDWNLAQDEFVWPEDPWRLAGPAPPGGHAGLQDMVHPEDLLHFLRTLNEAAETGEPYKDEYRLTRTDGRIVWVSARGYIVRDADGSVLRVIGVAQDVSDIKQAEQALRASERELRLITDAVPAFISYADSGEILRFCNKALATFVGAQAQDLIGRALRHLYGEDVYPVLQPYVRRALAGEKVQFQRSQAKREGGTIDLDATYIPRRGALGEVEGFYALLTDITELKRLDRMKSEFVSTVSHELRTPLTSIRGSLGILSGGVAGPLSEKVRGFIEIAKDNCERLIRLINDILDMEKIESGKMSFQLQVVDLMQLVEQTVEANEGYAAQHQVRLQIVSTRPGAKVQADRDRLAQVLTNLISNACKFSPAHGSVDISVSAQGERCRVGVVDRGPGISDAFRQRIFQKFSQEDSTDMRQGGGTGLGLSISKAIVEGLGGEIGFETGLNQGSTFYFILPLWHEPRGAA